MSTDTEAMVHVTYNEFSELKERLKVKTEMAELRDKEHKALIRALVAWKKAMAGYSLVHFLEREYSALEIDGAFIDHCVRSNVFDDI